MSFVDAPCRALDFSVHSHTPVQQVAPLVARNDAHVPEPSEQVFSTFVPQAVDAAPCSIMHLLPTPPCTVTWTCLRSQRRSVLVDKDSSQM